MKSFINIQIVSASLMSPLMLAQLPSSNLMNDRMTAVCIASTLTEFLAGGNVKEVGQNSLTIYTW